MSALNNYNNFTEDYDTDMFDVPMLLRDSSIQQQQQHRLQGPDNWLLGKHERRGFFGEEEMDIEDLIQQSAI